MNACTEFRRQITRLFLANRRAEEDRELAAHLISCKACKGFRAQLNDMQSAYTRLPQVAASFQTLQKINRDLFAPPKTKRLIPWDVIGKGAAGLAIFLALIMGGKALWQRAQTGAKEGASIAKKNSKELPAKTASTNVEPTQESDPWESLMATHESVLSQNQNAQVGSDRFDQISNKLKKDLKTDISVNELDSTLTNPAKSSELPSDKPDLKIDDEKILPMDASPIDQEKMLPLAKTEPLKHAPPQKSEPGKNADKPKPVGDTDELPATVMGPVATASGQPNVPKKNPQIKNDPSPLSQLKQKPLTDLGWIERASIENVNAAIDELELTLEDCDAEALFWAAFALEAGAIDGGTQGDQLGEASSGDADYSESQDEGEALVIDDAVTIDISPEAIEAYLSAGMPFWDGVRADVNLPGRSHVPGVLTNGLAGLGRPWLGIPGGALPGGGRGPWLGEPAGEGAMGGLSGLGAGSSGGNHLRHLRRPRMDLHLNYCPVMAVTE